MQHASRSKLVVMRRLVLLIAVLSRVGSLEGMTLLEEGYRQMYNLQFAQAHRALAEYAREHPNDPMGPIADGAAYLYSEFDRLRILQSELFTEDKKFLDFKKPAADPVASANFHAALDRGRVIIDRTLQ